jgi:hypothetical protein
MGEGSATSPRQLSRRLGAPLPVEPPAANGGDKRTRRAATKPTGRRDLRLLDLPEERIELIDPVLRRHGQADRLGRELQAVVAAGRVRPAGHRAREVP